MKNIFNFIIYSFNYKILNLYQKYGVNIKKKNEFKNIFLADLFKKILEKYVVKKDILLKRSFYNRLNFIESGSYIGYRIVRGLPLYHQRTKTNAQTNRKEDLHRKINKKKKNHYKKKRNV